MPRRRISKKPYKKKTYRKKTASRNFKKKVLSVSETKYQKDITDWTTSANNIILPGLKVVAPNLAYAAEMSYMTPYCSAITGYTTSDIWNVQPVEESTPPGEDAFKLRFGSFITQGGTSENRIGDRITMVKSVLNLHFHFKPIPNPTLPGSVYTWEAYPDIRVIHGWCKQGLDGYQRLQNDFLQTGKFSEIDYSKYKVLSDRVMTRQMMSTGEYIYRGDGVAPTGASQVGSYKPFKLRFVWGGHKMKFTNGNLNQVNNLDYTGWTPFLIIINNNANSVQLELDYCKRVNLFKDI